MIESSCRESSCRVEVQSRGIESRHRVEAQNRGIELSCRVEVQRAKLQSRGIESGYRVDVQSRGSSSPVPPLSTTKECFGGLFLDLFDALNPPVASICP